jgi:hypothetical protein
LNEIKIQDLLRDYQKYHSEFQIENFIIKGQGDEWAQYKQCLREIKSRYESIKEERAKVESAGIEPKQKRFYWPSKANKLNIKLAKKSQALQLKELRNTINDKQRELNCFVEIATKLKDKLGEITDERRQQLELESWTAKGRRMAAIDRILTGGISHQTFEFILSLPLKSQNSILDKILPNDPERRLLIESLKEEVTK